MITHAAFCLLIVGGKEKRNLKKIKDGFRKNFKLFLNIEILIVDSSNKTGERECVGVSLSLVPEP